MTTIPNRDRAPRIARRLAAPILLSAAIGSLVLAVPPLRGVAAQIDRVQPAWVLVAVGLELGSCAGFVVIFRLYFDGVGSGTARELAWTEQGSGALLPGGGVGALAIGGWLLRRAGMSTKSIVDRSSALFFLTSAVNVAALVGAGALLAVTARAGAFGFVRSGVPILGGLAAAAAVLAIPIVICRSPHRDWPEWADRPRRRHRPGASLAQGTELAAARRRRLSRLRHRRTRRRLCRHRAPAPHRAARARLSDRLPRESDSGTRWLRRARGGLAGTLIAYGAPATQATAAVIVYHAIAFWIPSLGGLVGFALLRRRLGAFEPTAERAVVPAAQRPTPSSRSVASSGTPPKYASSTCTKIGFAESA